MGSNLKFVSFLGPPVAGYIYDHVGNYIPAFLAAGVPPIVGALAMFSIRCIKIKPGKKLFKLPKSFEIFIILFPDLSEKCENYVASNDTKEKVDAVESA